MFNRQRRSSAPATVLSQQFEQLPQIREHGALEIPKEKKKDKSKSKRRQRQSFSGSSDNDDLSEFALPGLAEEGTDVGDFRPRAQSAGLKSLIRFRNRNKSGDKEHSAGSNERLNNNSINDHKGTKKGFFDNFTFGRSKSDAASLKQAQANMLRKKHASGGHITPVSQQSSMDAPSSSDMEPMPRGRSTSWGARDRLKMQIFDKDKRPTTTTKSTDGTTIMSQLISSSSSSLKHKSQDGSTASSSTENSEHVYTGQALIWENDDDTQEEGKPKGLNSYMDRMQIEDIEVNDPMVFNKFMRAHRCYDIVPISSKLVVFDTSLSVKKAFYALVYNCVRAAPLWDNKTQNFIGMLTITDFIKILTKYYKTPNDAAYMAKMVELEEHHISSWRKELKHWYHPFVFVSPEASVCEAVRRLTTTKVHRLPVIDPVSGNAVYIITHKRILKFIHLYMKNLPKPSYMNDSLEKLELGTFTNIAKAEENMRVIDALQLFISRRVSALPVVDGTDRVVDVYAKFDVLNLAAEKSYNDLEISVKTAISFRKQKQEGVLTCLATDTLGNVVDRIVKHGVHRLIVTTPAGQLHGIISLSDILHFLLQEDPKLKAVASTTSCASSTNGIQSIIQADGIQAR